MPPALVTSLSQLSIKTRIETQAVLGRPGKERSSLSQLSIKTRIETQGAKHESKSWNSLSQLSIKTRIETMKYSNQTQHRPLVWVSYPLKQGLKPESGDYCQCKILVWVSYPLKQGLKRKARCNTAHVQIVWVSYPLKQGLKLWNHQMSPVLPSFCLSQLSIKTRIETFFSPKTKKARFSFESAIH